jgi:hypothetical protein
MARKRFWKLVLLSLLVFGLLLTGCPTDGGNNNENDGKDDAKKLTITGIEGISGNVSVMFTTVVNDQSAAILIKDDGSNSGTGVGGRGTISNGTITISLKVIQYPLNSKPIITDDNWTGTGNYYIWLWNDNEFSGSPPYSAPVSASWNEKVGFSSATTTVPWNKFGQSPE